MSDPQMSLPVSGSVVPAEEGVVELLQPVDSANSLPSSSSFSVDLGTLDVPPEVLRRIKALKKLQVETTQIESQFMRELHDLEVKYATLYAKQFEKRKEIVLGKYEPSDMECEFLPTTPGGENPEGAEKLAVSLTNLKLENGTDKPVSGVPDFWLTIFRNVDLLADMVHEHDVPVLKHLTDIKVEITNEPMGFKLLFHFSPNEYFNNEVLTKTYVMKCEVDQQDPFSFEGPEIVKCSGCKIDWKEGKNVTVRVVQKKQKHKQRGSIRLVSRTEEVPSFFEFFNPPEVGNESEVDEEIQSRLTSDFEIGQYIREHIVPRAVLYYTGECLEDDDDDDEEEEDEEDDDESEEDEEDEAVIITAGQPNNPECKQQ